MKLLKLSTCLLLLSLLNGCDAEGIQALNGLKDIAASLSSEDKKEEALPLIVFGGTKLKLNKTNIIESEGNKDNIINRGESVYIFPSFTNTGGKASSDLKIELVINSSFVETSTKTINLEKIKVGATSVNPSMYNSFKVNIEKTTPENTVIPITYIVTDEEDKRTEFKDSITVRVINNNILMEKTELIEREGNKDNIPNRGESFYLKPIFTNNGSSSTNNLNVKASSSSSFVTISESSISINSIKPGLNSEPIESNYSSFIMNIDKSVPDGTNIPIKYTLTDSYGNKWQVDDNIVVQGVNNSLTMGTTEIVESEGNGDNIINRGESLYIKPTFTNTGNSSTNNLSVKVSSTSSYITCSPSAVSIDSIKSGLTSLPIESIYSSLSVKINDSIPENTIIPLTYDISDSLGNKWQVNDNLTVKAIDNILTLSKIEIVESDGNGDNVVNRGESIYIKPSFVNTGTSATNNLNVKLSSSSSMITINSYSSMSVDSIKPNLSSKLPESNYMSLGASISTDAEPGTIIPLTFMLNDNFGNKWTINDNLIVK